MQGFFPESWWLRLHACIAEGTGSIPIPVWGTGSPYAGSSGQNMKLIFLKSCMQIKF